MSSIKYDAAAHLKEIAENIPGVILQYLLKADGTSMFPFMSGQIESILGFTARQIKADANMIIDRIHKDDLPMVIQAILHSAKTLDVYDLEHRITGKNGKIVWVRAIGTPHRFKNGDVLFNAMAIDITAQKKSEEALTIAEERFKIITEESPNMIFINQKGKVVYVNRRSQEMMGYTIEEFTAPDFDFLDLIAPESISLVSANFQNHMQGIDIDPYEYTLLTKNKERLRCIITTKLIHYEGEPAILGIVTDITERKRAEEALKISEERYRIVSQLTSDFAYAYRVNEDLTIENEWVTGAMARITGYDLEQLKKHGGWGSLVYDEDMHIIQSQLNILLKGEAKTVIYRIVSKQGDIRWMLDYARPEWSPQLGRITHIYGAVQDITQRKVSEQEKENLEARYLQAQKMEAIGTLAGGVAHDFNNLLMGIQGQTSLMLLEIDVNHSHYPKLKAIESYVDNAADLSKKLLGFARSGKYETKPTDINILVGTTIEMFGRTRKELTIHTLLDPEIWSVEIDQTQIVQVLMNLLVNAWQAMPDGGEVTIETKNKAIRNNQAAVHQVAAGNFVRVSVKDTGVGIAPKHIDKIFDPFFTTKKRGRGTGLGLASAYGIINNHGGFILVKSKLGKGSNFEFYLPASEKASVIEPSGPDIIIGGTETILLVDDEDIIIDSCTMLLEKLGYYVYIARNGKEAIQIFKKHHESIDLVILDIIMPNMAGGEVFDKLKAIDPDVRVLLSSGYSIDGKAKKIMEKGCKGFIQKPFNIHQLAAKIKQLLGTH